MSDDRVHTAPSTTAPAEPGAAPASLIPIFEPAEAPGGTFNTWILPNMGAIVAAAVLWVGLFMGLDAKAWGIAFAAYLFNRLGHVLTVLAVRGLPQTVAVAAAGFGMMLRIWLIAFALFLVGAEVGSIGMGDKDLALTAILLFILFFTVDVAARSLLHMRTYRNIPAPASADPLQEETPT